MFSFRKIQANLKVVEALVYSYIQDEVKLKMVTVPRVNIVRNTSYVMDQELINKFEFYAIKTFTLLTFLYIGKQINYKIMSI
jgi:hypothetical protein